MGSGISREGSRKVEGREVASQKIEGREVESRKVGKIVLSLR